MPPTSRARAIDQVVAAAPKIKAVEHSASRLCPNPSSPKAKEELMVAVGCQESTQTHCITLKANKTKRYGASLGESKNL
jgi:hypothetical protein